MICLLMKLGLLVNKWYLLKGAISLWAILSSVYLFVAFKMVQSGDYALLIKCCCAYICLYIWVIVFDIFLSMAF